MTALDDASTVWTLRAQRRLEQVLFRVGEDQLTDREPTKQLIARALRESFPDSDCRVIEDVYLGFRPRPNEFILLVEVSRHGDSRRYVVKVGDEGDLQRELDAWQRCKPAGHLHDVVLMRLDARYANGVREASRLVSLVYEDAQQSIGMDRTATLEDAFLDAVEFDNPTIQSVTNVICQVLHRLGHLFYRAASVREYTELRGAERDTASSKDTSAQFDIRLNGQHWLEESFAAWETWPAAVEARREALAALRAGTDEERFLDPVEYLRYVLCEIREGRPARDFIPRMLRGKTHGDLHGRNILVGLFAGEAHWPALFDYEDMATDNLLAWDFVKLETELKIRAFPRLFPDLNRFFFPRKLWEFETELSKRTEECKRSGTWSALPAQQPADRLLAALLAIRSLAARYLGTEHSRTDEWLEEYYFALSCYGVYAIRFENQSPRERLGVVILAGTAAARFEYSREIRRTLTTPAVGSGAGDDRKKPADDLEILAHHYPNYHWPFRAVWSANREGTPEHFTYALKLASVLKARYPHVLAIRFERALALVNLERRSEAIKELDEASREFTLLDEDTLSLIARCYKSKGDEALRGEALPEAERDYAVAIDTYERAYALVGNRFSGINVASLKLILASVLAAEHAHGTEEVRKRIEALRQSSQRMARELFERRLDWKEALPDDNIWIRATEAEACLLLQRWDDAARLYRTAIHEDNAKPFHVQSMKAQAARIVEAFVSLGVAVGDSFLNINAVFRGP